MTDRDAMNKQFALEAFEYRDGDLFWRERPIHHFASQWSQRIFNSRQAGAKAGTIVSGYVLVKLSFGRFAAHRIIFLMHHGFMPQEVDHIDGDPLNNRIENLRQATHAENLRNMKTTAHNTSGVKGVSWHMGSKKWAAGIRVGGAWRHLGVFTEKADAVSARKRAEATHYGEFSNGR